MCDIDPQKCDVCTEEGAKFDEGQSKCIVGDDSGGGGGGGGLGAGPIIGESVGSDSGSVLKKNIRGYNFVKKDRW